MEIHDGVETPIGHGAARLYNDLDELVEQARKHVRLERSSANVAPDDLREALPQVLQKYVKTHYMEPISGGFAHCRCTPGKVADLAQALCLERKREQTGTTKDQRPDYAYASIEDCLGQCIHGLAFSENKRVIDKTLERGQSADRTKPNAIVNSIVASLAAAKSAVNGRGGV
jgi:hypothetical protein